MHERNAMHLTDFNSLGAEDIPRKNGSYETSPAPHQEQ